jgi:hypothetical protein
VASVEPSLSALVLQERPREVPLRDVRDLALAVIEGAVAAEALAQELRRAPERSTHFREIAERLRAVVSRSSIREALIDDRPPQVLQLGDGSTAKVAAPEPAEAPSPAPPPPTPHPRRPSPPPPRETPQSGARRLPEATVSELLEALARGLPLGEIVDRVAALEVAVAQLLRRCGVERRVLRDVEEVLAFSTQLAARVMCGDSITVEYAPSDEGGGRRSSVP